MELSDIVMFRMAVFPNIWMNKPYKWVRGFWKKQTDTAKENMTYDKVKLKTAGKTGMCKKRESDSTRCLCSL